ncbi:beta-ketoacyl-ACP synthase II [uncultured Subdoligranulum sp.]|uniref:beta-ketoacyl-ACP synthase II n=1 Tax=uncultured Subdoligranulum sp. TaxID=512298 RepID=UPI0025E8C8A2|nr:beta-ketoacyl-ACP synthase II [uncultured Subdoligranulum sp.]
MDKRRVVITGLGTVNPTGNTVAQSWAAVRNGVCGVGPITHYDTSNSKTKLAAEVKDFDPAVRVDKRESRKMARFTQFAMAAAIEAMEDAGIDMEKTDATRFATIVSAGIGGLPNMEEEHAKGEQKGFDRVSPFFVPMTIANMAAGQIAIRFGLKGMCVAPVTACAGGTNAIGDAFHRIRDGYEDLALCGGAESCISPLGVGGFTSMKALTAATDPARASLPFDAERGGFVIGEGAGILVLEELEHALARGAKIYAEVVGYGTNCDAHHITAPAPGGAGGAACMQLALADAGIRPEDIGYINAHGTGTHLNDSCETEAIKTAFGAHAYKLHISSTKSMTGHLLGAAGGVEGIFTALALHDGYLPATINLKVPDPACDLDYIPNVGLNEQVEYAMSDSLGFGGHNACVIFKRWEG